MKIADSTDWQEERVSEMHCASKYRIARAVLVHTTHSQYIEALQLFHSKGLEGLAGFERYFAIDCTEQQCMIRATEHFQLYKLTLNKFEPLPGTSTLTYALPKG